MEAILAGCGFEMVASVESAGEALVAASLSEPDVVVVDLALTGDLGLKVISALRTAQPSCAVVVLSPFPSLRGPALEAGAYDFVADSSSDLRELERCMRRLSDARRRAVDLDEAGPRRGDQGAAGTPSPPRVAGRRSTKASSS